MGIIVDRRAGSKELMDYPLPDASLDELPSADVMLVGNGPDGEVLVGVELKSVTDLVSSTSTGRLQATQVPAMLDDYDVCWLLVYGAYRAGVKEGELQIQKGPRWWRKYRMGNREVPWSYVEAFLLSLSVVGVQIKHVYDMAEAARWIGVLDGWWSKPYDKHRAFRTFDHSRDVSLMPGMSEAEMLRARVANCLPGVGHERAMAAARHFRSVKEMVAADREEWEEIDGIGKVISRTVEEAVR